MTTLSQLQREELRYAVREQLVGAKTVALSAEMLKRRVERARLLDFSFTEADIDDALFVVVSLGFATTAPTSLGATKFYQATAAGVLAHERGQ